MIRVVVESPYAGDVVRNVAYARRCVRDSLRRGESPYASHLFFTQPGLFDDSVPDEREQGIAAGFAWAEAAERVYFYVDLGWSSGMRRGLYRAHDARQTYALRSFPNDLLGTVSTGPSIVQLAEVARLLRERP